MLLSESPRNPQEVFFRLSLIEDEIPAELVSEAALGREFIGKTSFPYKCPNTLEYCNFFLSLSTENKVQLIAIISKSPKMKSGSPFKYNLKTCRCSLPISPKKLFPKKL